MKRSACSILAMLLLVSALSMNCYAIDDKSEIYNTIHFDDGIYLTECIYITQTRSSGTVSGRKVDTYYASDGATAWQAVLKGTFSYTGSSATCTASSCDVTIYDSAWYIVSKSASKSGNKATASVTMGYKALGVTVNKGPISMSLSCDANGNLS